jgi:hypothetical protein
MMRIVVESDIDSLENEAQLRKWDGTLLKGQVKRILDRPVVWIGVHGGQLE